MNLPRCLVAGDPRNHPAFEQGSLNATYALNGSVGAKGNIQPPLIKTREPYDKQSALKGGADYLGADKQITAGSFRTLVHIFPPLNDNRSTRRNCKHLHSKAATPERPTVTNNPVSALRRQPSMTPHVTHCQQLRERPPA